MQIKHVAEGNDHDIRKRMTRIHRVIRIRIVRRHVAPHGAAQSLQQEIEDHEPILREASGWRLVGKGRNIRIFPRLTASLYCQPLAVRS